MLRRQLLIGLLAGCVAAIPAVAGNKATQASQKSGAQFLKNAAEINVAEIQLGKLAQEKSSNDAVKDFGKRMVDDHTKINDNLKTLAATQSVTLPDSMNAKDKALDKRLEKLSGTRFDRQYIQAMISGHEQAVAAFRKESKMAKNADVRDFAAKTLPTLEEHLKAARDANMKIGAVTKR
jgi:putative membrane protein